MNEATERVEPAWAEWAGGHSLGPWTLGVEEEAMLLDPRTWALAHRIDELLPRLPVDTQHRVSAETHGSAFEVQTGVARTVAEAVEEIRGLRRELDRTLATLGLRAAVSGTHPFAIWQEIAVSGGERYQFVYGSMRELARREPTFALHVHVGVPDPDTAIRVNDRMRVHLPLLLALSANSPFWQGRDSGLASARTPLFQAFPRVGVPRAFGDYETYVETVDLLIRTRGRARIDLPLVGRAPAARSRHDRGQGHGRPDHAAATPPPSWPSSSARGQAGGRAGLATDGAIAAPEVISENRFLAARDGVDAKLIDPDLETRIPVPELLDDLLEVCRPHAQDLGCATSSSPSPTSSRTPRTSARSQRRRTPRPWVAWWSA